MSGFNESTVLGILYSCFLIFTFFSIYFNYKNLNTFKFDESDTNKIVIDNNPEKDKNLTFYKVLYVVLSVLLSLILNLILAGNICSSPNWGTAIAYTLLPWLLIFGLTYFLINYISGWQNPFANTIGYLISKLAGITHVKEELFKAKDNSIINKINELNKDPSIFINNLNPNNFEYIIKQTFSQGETDKSTPPKLDLINKLYKLTQLRFIIAQNLWYLLIGIFTITVSVNYIQSLECDLSPEEQESKENSFNATNNEITKTASSDRAVYSS